MSMQKSDIEKIAHLARLSVSADDAASYVQDLSGILALVEQMNSVDTDQVIPMAHPMDAEQRLRADVVTETDQRDQFQAVAPKVEDGLYLVPRVIE